MPYLEILVFNCINGSSHKTRKQCRRRPPPPRMTCHLIWIRMWGVVCYWKHWCAMKRIMSLYPRASIETHRIWRMVMVNPHPLMLSNGTILCTRNHWNVTDDKIRIQEWHFFKNQRRLVCIPTIIEMPFIGKPMVRECFITFLWNCYNIILLLVLLFSWRCRFPYIFLSTNRVLKETLTWNTNSEAIENEVWINPLYLCPKKSSASEWPDFIFGGRFASTRRRCQCCNSIWFNTASIESTSGRASGWCFAPSRRSSAFQWWRESRTFWFDS